MGTHIEGERVSRGTFGADQLLQVMRVHRDVGAGRGYALRHVDALIPRRAHESATEVLFCRLPDPEQDIASCHQYE